jgi:hypothetical protein
MYGLIFEWDNYFQNVNDCDMFIFGFSWVELELILSLELILTWI